MNRDEILAAYRAGKITAAELRAQLAALPGIRVGFAPRTEQIFAQDVEIDETSRTISGTITIFGVASTDGRIIEPGALTARDPLDRVKLLIDHDQTQSVGYMTELSIEADRARATFHVPETPEGDDALKRAKLKIRNGLSVGFAALPGSYFWDEDDNLHFTRGELYETSLCAIPAFQDAQVEEVAAQLAHHRKENHRMNRDQILAAFAAGTITAEQRDAALAVLGIEAPAEPPAAAFSDAQLAQLRALGFPGQPGVAVPPEFAAGPQGTGSSTAPAHTQDRPTSFAQIRREVAGFARAGDVGGLIRYVNAELGKIAVGDVEDGFLRAEWAGELWSAATAGRPWIDSFGGPKPLTSDKVEGFRWAYPDEYTGVGTDVEARAKIYGGNFAEVPTGTRKLVKVSMDPDQWGVAVKVDNITIDLGSPDLVESLFRAFALDYDRDSDARVRDLVVAAATFPTTVDGADPDTDPDPVLDASVVAALTGLALDLKRVGGSLDRVWVAEDVFTDFSELTVSQLPAWLANMLGFVDVTDGSAQVSSKLRFEIDFGLPSGSLVGYDRRAATVKEKADIKLRALDVAHRATDMGFFSYGGVLINDARAIRLRTLA